MCVLLPFRLVVRCETEFDGRYLVFRSLFYTLFVITVVKVNSIIILLEVLILS